MNQTIAPRPAPPILAKDGLGAFRGSNYWYDLWSMLAAITFNHLFSLRTEGMHNVPRSGPVLVVANHQSFLDPMLVGLAVRRHLIYLARKTLFRNRFFGWAIRSFNAVPIDQEGVGKEGIKTILQQLQAGKPVLVFPEGERTRHRGMQPFKPGVQLLIKRAMAPILPVGIAGAYDAWPRWRKYPLPSPLFMPASERTIAVSIGKPLEADRFAALPRDQALQALYDEIHRAHERAERLRRQ
jgi:1-acyl-sn-glycerol-3-phosphate acyltransferase